jgi:hypothetical protein
MAIDGRDAGSPSGEAITSPLACTDWAQSQRLDPVGNAGYYEGFLLVEQPLPWPFDVATVPELVEVAQLAGSAGLRLQTVMRIPPRLDGEPGRPEPYRAGERQEGDGDGGVGASAAGIDSHPARDPGAGPGPGADVEVELEHRGLDLDPDRSRRLICYRTARPGWAGPLVRYERVANLSSLVEEARALVSATTPPADEGDPSSAVADVLVCTHGRRDSCCGARGIELLNELRRRPAFRAPVRLWRTSHTGGHRFAPTAIVLPAGSLWAWAGPALLEEVVCADGDLAAALSRYRGCATVGSPSQQAVERAVLAEVGWSLFSSWRRAVDLEDGLVRLETELAGAWEANVKEGRHVPQPDCRTPSELAKKQGVEWVVEGLRQVVPA